MTVPKPEASDIRTPASVLSGARSGELAHTALPLPWRRVQARSGALLAVVHGVVLPVAVGQRNAHGHVATAGPVRSALAPPARQETTVQQLVGFCPILGTCAEDAGAGADGRARVGSGWVGRGVEWRGVGWCGAGWCGGCGVGQCGVWQCSAEQCGVGAGRGLGCGSARPLRVSVGLWVCRCLWVVRCGLVPSAFICSMQSREHICERDH